MATETRIVAPSMVRKLNESPTSHRKIFLAGRPKSAGKTTFALTLPGKKLVLSYDLGMVPNVPGVNQDEVYVVQYPPASPSILGDSDRWKRATNVGERIILDIEEIRKAFVEDRLITLGAQTIPRPDVLILDGLTELQAIILDWVLGVNARTDPDEFENRFTAWGKRLNVMRTLFNMTIPLPCSVVLIAWEAAEMVTVRGGKGQSIQEATGKIIPDVGGRLDNITPGKVDAALRCYAKYLEGGIRYYVQCVPDGIREWVGVRGRYSGPKEVDVTLTPGKPLPAARVFGEEER